MSASKIRSRHEHSAVGIGSYDYGRRDEDLVPAADYLDNVVTGMGTRVSPRHRAREVAVDKTVDL